MFTDKKATEVEIYQFLDDQNIPHAGRGFVYMVFILYSLCNDSQIRNKRKVMPLYQLAAEQYSATAPAVERSIRNMLSKCGVSKTNGEYIFWAADSILLKKMAA